MNLKVRIDNKIFDVKVGNTKIRPIIVEVDGDVFEIWPDSENDYGSIQSQMRISDQPYMAQKSNLTVPDDLTRSLQSEIPNSIDLSTLRSNTIRAPIPGVITEVNVDVGSEVSVGEELLKLEAMKMNNSIRSHRAGVIRAVHVSIGQIVKHNEQLLEFSS